MEDLKVNSDKGVVRISNTEDRILWQANVSELDSTGIHECLSACVLSLSRREWCTLDCLYRVAEIIEREHPDSMIDWTWTLSLAETFFEDKQIPLWEMQKHWANVPYEIKEAIEAVVSEKLFEY
jgi:hypothetical protein